jgi:hypothetical protein
MVRPLVVVKAGVGETDLAVLSEVVPIGWTGIGVC